MSGIRHRRHRRLTDSAKAQQNERKRRSTEHTAQVNALKQRFSGLGPEDIMETLHPLEVRFPNVDLNTLQRAIVCCMSRCGGSATFDELEAFCAVHWKLISKRSHRKGDGTGPPTKRIFKIIFSVKKNGFPLFVESPGDSNRYQIYTPERQFEDELMDILRGRGGRYSIDELAGSISDPDNVRGSFMGLSSARRVRAQLLMYRRLGIVEYDEVTDKWGLPVLASGMGLNMNMMPTPMYLQGVHVKNMSVGQLYDRMRGRRE